MAAVSDVEEVVKQYHLALGEFMKGNPEPAQKLFSHREDVTLANPRGGVAHGWEQVAKTMEHAAASRRDGDAIGFEIVAKYVTPELAYVVEVERLKAKIGGGEDITPYALRVTMILRPEDGTWKVVHRHADQLTTAQPATTYESAIQK
jgi:ketosteroid isomerase-like protein